MIAMRCAVLARLCLAALCRWLRTGRGVLLPGSPSRVAILRSGFVAAIASYLIRQID